MEDNAHYVGLSAPQEIKKELLEISRDVFLCLQEYEKSKLVDLKFESEKKFVEHKMAEMMALLKRIKTDLPSGVGSSSQIIQEKPKKLSKKINLPMNQLEKIEMQLDEIEEKISDL